VWDVEAAQRAGLPCIGLTCGGISAQELHDAGAAAVYDDPADLLEHLDDSPSAALPLARPATKTASEGR
jgi:phosphoglycolate phosphatase-like HAD superfamily hydrolase